MNLTAVSKLLFSKFKEWLFINKYYLRENYLEWKHLRKSLNWQEDYENFLHQYSPCFVLSTGRCGTLLLSNILKLNKNTSVYHSDYLVPNPLLKLFQNKAFGEKDQSVLIKVLEASRGELIYRTYRTKRLYIETNSRFTFFAYAAKELFPKARFINLVRNPASFVVSGIRRGYYSANDMESIGRLREAKQGWDEKKAIEKIGWLWNETQKYIEGFKSKYNESLITVKAENLFESIEESKRIFDFLNLKPPKDSTLRRAISRPVNKQLTGSCERYEQWSESDKELLKKSASLYSEYGYVL